MAEVAQDNYFGTFLETVQAKEKAPDVGSAPIAMITTLEDRGSMSVRDLQTAVHLDLLAFSKALETLSEADLVELQGPAGEESVSLTEHGHRLAELQLSMA